MNLEELIALVRTVRCFGPVEGGDRHLREARPA